jgi:hypothetical protein
MERLEIKKNGFLKCVLEFNRSISKIMPSYVNGLKDEEKNIRKLKYFLQLATSLKLPGKFNRIQTEYDRYWRKLSFYFFANIFEHFLFLFSCIQSLNYPKCCFNEKNVRGKNSRIGC